MSELTKKNGIPFILFQSKRRFEDGKEGARGGGWPSIYAGEWVSEWVSTSRLLRVVRFSKWLRSVGWGGPKEK